MSAFLAHAPRRLRAVAALAVFLALAAGAAAQTETGRITGRRHRRDRRDPARRHRQRESGRHRRHARTGHRQRWPVRVRQPASGRIRDRRDARRLQPGEREGDGLGRRRRQRRPQDGRRRDQGKHQRRRGSAARSTSSNAEVSTTITETQIRELPTITRNVYDLVAVAGNVSGGKVADGEEWTGDTRGTGYNINGQRASSTNILLDGSANNNEFDTTVGQNVPLDSVQEFSVVTSNFSAQYGRATGGIVNVLTKSGTNSFRGTGYDFYRSDKLATNTFDNKANGIEKGEFKRHQLGFSIGGPIRRDKVHFFTQSRIHPRPQRRHADQLGADAASSSPPARRRRSDFFAAYGGGVDDQRPGADPRRRQSAILGRRRRARSAPAGRPAGVRPRREVAADRCRRRRPAERLPVGVSASTSRLEQQHADVRPLRDAGPGGGAGHQLGQPVRRLRYRIRRTRTTTSWLADPRLRLDASPPRRSSPGTGCSAISRSTATPSRRST